MAWYRVVSADARCFTEKTMEPAGVNLSSVLTWVEGAQIGDLPQSDRCMVEPPRRRDESPQADQLSSSTEDCTPLLQKRSIYSWLVDMLD